MKIWTFASIATIAGATSALAGSITEPEVTAPVTPPPAVVAPASADWTGFYVGGQIGRGEFENSEDISFDVEALAIHAGYLHDLGDFVIGAEADYGNFTAIADGEEFEDKLGRIKAIVGYDAGQFLPYATAGFAVWEIGDGDVPTSDTTGTFFGVGAIYKATDSVSVGAEVLSHSFEDAFDQDGFDIDGTTASLKVSFHF